ncbi:hypothetical protein IWQ60_008750 [Tieghemiomyces parasiticus]|uniref:Uncharacterized protein n=1 Tax=Tieghemiomyces parasiticus TaxID=78921 RepID=A0A9W7ZYU5_9FUNG|nr:hypothetical protein IWQ60_008750 [Tieghemiomyces parasiticus]
MLSKYISSSRPSSESLLSSNSTVVDAQTTAQNQQQMESDLNDLHRRLQSPGLSGLTNQRVELTESQRSRMDLAKLVTTVKRMGRGRLVKQEALYYSPSERRSQDILGFLERMDRFDVPDLSDRQRFTPRPVPV